MNTSRLPRQEAVHIAVTSTWQKWCCFISKFLCLNIPLWSSGKDVWHLVPLFVWDHSGYSWQGIVSGVIQLPSNGCNESSCVQPSDNSMEEFKTGLSLKDREKIGASAIVSGLLEWQKCTNSLLYCVTLFCTCCSSPSASANQPFNVIIAAIGKRHW